MAFTGVRPVAEIELARRALSEGHADEPGVGGNGKIGSMRSYISRTFAVQQVVVDPFAMNVVGQQLIAVPRRKIVRQINQGPAVSMPTPGRVFGVRAQPTAGIGQPNKVQVIGDRIDTLVSELAALTAAPGFVMRPLNDLEQMRIEAIASERVSVIVPVQAPRVGHAIGVR